MPDTNQQAIQKYAQRLEDLLESCAVHQVHDREVFLWNARRALEAMCRILLLAPHSGGAAPNGAGHEQGLDTMLKELKRRNQLGRDQETRFDYLREFTNSGVHIHKPDRPNYKAAVEDTERALPGLVDWLYNESPAASLLSQTGPIRGFSEEIKKGGRPGLPPVQEAKQARAELEKAAARHAAELATLRRDLAAVTTRANDAETKVAQRRRRFWQSLATVSMLVGVAFVLGVGVGLVGPGPARAIASNVTRQADPPAPAPAPEATLTSAAAPVPFEPPVPHCTDDRVLIPESTIHLGQPEGGRNNWPDPRTRKLKPETVPAFCIDAKPLVRTASAAVDCEPKRDKSKDGNTLVCLTRDEAEATCKRAGAELPSIAQWEAVARGTLVPHELAIGEWVADRFPAAIFNLKEPGWTRGDAMWVGVLKRKPTGAEGHVLMSWNQAKQDLRSATIGLRCASPVIE